MNRDVLIVACVVLGGAGACAERSTPSAASSAAPATPSPSEAAAAMDSRTPVPLLPLG